MPDLITGPRKEAPRPAPQSGGSVGNIFAGESEALMRMGSEIRRSGHVLAGALERRNYIDYIDEYNAGVIAYDQHLYDDAKVRAKETDLKGKPKRFSIRDSEWRQNYLKNVKSNPARKRLKSYFGKNSIREELGIFQSSLKDRIARIDESQPGLQKININDELNVTIDDDTERERVKSEIRAEYAEPLAGLVKAGEMSQARADEWMHERARKLVMTAIDRDPVVTKEILYGEGIDTILTKADEELLGLEDMEYLRNRAAAAERHRQLKHKDEQEKELMAAEEMAWDISRTGDVLGLEDLLDTLNIPTADKKRLLGDAHRTAKLLAEDKPNPYTTISKPDVYWKNYTKVLRDSDSMTEREITAMVPDVCGINQAKEILNLKKKPEDDPLKSPQAAMYLKRLESLYIKSGKLTGYIETTAEWDKLNRILIRHIEENPKETAEELGKFFEALVKPYKEKKITKFLKAVGKIYDYRMLARGDYGFKLAGALGWTEGEGEGKEEEVAITKTATNPKTGKKIGWNGTKWIPIP